MDDQKRSFGEVLVAQWPGVLGFGLIGLGLFWIWYVHENGGVISFRLVALLFGGGIASILYWSLANRSDGYNF
jgi:hypothetical protein